jgi:hypothetical protein
MKEPTSLVTLVLVVCCFALFGVLGLGLAGLTLVLTGHLPSIEIVLGGGAIIAIAIGSLSSN